jgi:molecular chaperone Hsp33
MPENQADETGGTVVTTDFVRHRNALLARADFGPLFTDYYLHLAEHGLRHTAVQDRLFKDALAAFALHCASRPAHEHLAWTLNFQQPRLNLFLAGDNEDFTVAGRLFTGNVREAERNVFFSDLLPRRGAETRRSVVDFDGSDALKAVEAYYAGSEQRPARCFYLGGDEYALLSAHPDCDEAWFASEDPISIRTVAERETLAPIERRAYRWACGCNQRKILGALAPAFRARPEEMFGGAESIRVQCPRCAATHVVTREAMEAWVAQAPKAGG